MAITDGFAKASEGHFATGLGKAVCNGHGLMF